MSLDTLDPNARPISGKNELLDTFRTAERPKGDLLIGLEHEKLLFAGDSSLPVPYDGASGVGALLERFQSYGYQSFREASDRPVIAMTKGRTTLSLEPGGQVELSGAPHASVRSAHAENVEHATQLLAVAKSVGVRVVAMGYRPFESLAKMPWMPKSRYEIMRQSLGARGTMAHDMMLMTATAQVSLDWRSEVDCARKVTAAARLTPVLVALFANSPIAQGKPTGFASWRSRVWNDVDAARCGIPDCLIDGGFSYDRYLDWVIDAPMLFLRRGNTYVFPNMTFRAFLEKGYEDQPALDSDWVDHLSTMFPEVRVKRVIEIRSADSNGVAMTGALAALMRGLLYDAVALDELDQALPRLSPAAHRALHRDAQQFGLAAQIEDRLLADVASEVVEIASRGLGRIDPGDVSLLQPLRAVAQSRKSPSVAVLEAFSKSRSPSDLLSRFEFSIDS